jgi:uracil phosphoribosyltransferase
METHILSQQNTVLNRFVTEMRDVRIQGDRMRFRRNLERAGEVMAYEISKTLAYTTQTVETPLGEATVSLPDEDIVVATILRAGIPYHQGFLNYFDGAGSAFVSAFRKYSKDGTFKVKVEYVSCGSLEGKTLLLVDPMLATGTSTVLTYQALLEKGGTPRHTHIASVIASEEGVAYVREHLPDNGVTIWCAAVDEELTVKSYIIPGLGDAGDLAYGDKL